MLSKDRHLKIIMQLIKKWYFGPYGGRFAPETLMPALDSVEKAYAAFRKSKAWNDRYQSLLRDYCGRETPLYFAESLTRKLGGARIFLKREDLNHTGAHKITNALGQALLGLFMGEKTTHRGNRCRPARGCDRNRSCASGP